MNTINGNIPNHLVWNIIATIIGTFTCCPLGLIGIVGIVFSSKVNGLVAQGDLAGAARASSNARTWAIVATVLAVIGILANVWVQMNGGTEALLQQIQAMQGGA